MTFFVQLKAQFPFRRVPAISLLYLDLTIISRNIEMCHEDSPSFNLNEPWRSKTKR